MIAAVYFPIIALSIGIAAFIGYYVGQKEADSSAASLDTKPNIEIEETEEKSPNDPKKMNDPKTETPKKRIISPESLAKEKNVPASLKNPQGDLTLVAVIETVATNAKLNQSIQVVTAQRQRLAHLSQQFDKTPTDSVQQRELIAGQINETRKTLEQNLGFMQKNYGYSLKNNYAYVPQKASLHEVTKVDGKPVSKLAYDFTNTESYRAFQSKRARYLRFKIQHVKAAQIAAAKDKKTDSPALAEGDKAVLVKPQAAKPLKLEDTAEMKEKIRELIKLYNYDPDKNYRIDIEKAALYARAAR